MSQRDISPVCVCLARVRDLPSCPAHGVFPTASKRIELEAEVERLMRHIHRAEHRAVVPFGECRMCDKMRDA
jgi:hypothetical protein